MFDSPIRLLLAAGGHKGHEKKKRAKLQKVVGRDFA